MALRGERPPIGLAWVITWPLSAVLAALVFLSAEELRHPGPGAAPTPATASGADWYERLPARIAAIDTALRKGPLRLAAVEETRGSGPLRFKYRLYEVQLPEAERPKAEAAIEAVRGIDPGLVLTTSQTADATEVRFGLDGLLVATTRFLWREHPETRPRLTLVIGPLGDDLRLARHAIEALEAPVVLGVNPARPFAAQVTELGKLFEREALVQYVVAPPPPPPPTLADPLETPAPRPRPAPTPPGLDESLAAVPGAIGVAWTGPPGVAPPKPSTALLAGVAQRGLIFVGARGDKDKSAAIPIPVQLAEAGEKVAAPAEQLEALATAARKQGRAIAICPPTDAMLAAVQAALPQWREAQLDVVPLSVLASGPLPTLEPTPAATPKR
ncbi:MAG: divergent polysaccharide deacetylase family protein [Deltaproteobacteria bacterium]|nr:divergent polysaccharide deacetylase family protein [Deltaproteobacteria bacterium]